MNLKGELEKASIEIGYCPECGQYTKDVFSYCGCGNYPTPLKVISLSALRGIFKQQYTKLKTVYEEKRNKGSGREKDSIIAILGQVILLKELEKSCILKQQLTKSKREKNK